MSKNNDDNESDNDNEVIKFPSLAERDRILKKQQQEKEFRKDYKRGSSEPFFNFGNIPPFTAGVTAIYIFIHVIISFALSFEMRGAAIDTLGFIPSIIINPGDWSVFTILTPITYNFLHGDWMHIGFNALMGLALGTFVEKMMSTRTVIKFYFLSGIGGAALFFILNPVTSIPVIGASASISGLFAAALLMIVESGRFGSISHTFAGKGAWRIVLIWGGIMVFIGLLSGGSVAWQAHLGGFLTGAALYRMMRLGKLRL